MGELKFVNIFKMRIAVLGFLALLIFGMILGTNPVEAQPFAYVANTDSDNVSVIDTATNMVVGLPIPVGDFPVGVAITPDGTRAYVANVNSDNVSVIDTATNMVVATIPVGDSRFGVAITPDCTRASVANLLSDNVSVIDTATNMTVGSPIPVGTGPRAVAITPIMGTPIIRAPIPTLSEWGLIAMASILGIVGFMVLRRRKVAA